MSSVLTNVSAQTALATLNATQASLRTTQNRISTGLRVSSAADNAAYFSIATTLRSDSSSLSAVSDALNLGSSTIDVASAGLKAATDIVGQIKDKLVSAASPGIDKSKVQSEIGQLQKQLKTIADGASLSGQNFLSTDSTATGYNANRNIVSSFSRDASGAVTVGTIAVDTSLTKLFDVSASATAVVTTGATASVVNSTITTPATPAVAPATTFATGNLQIVFGVATNAGNTTSTTGTVTVGSNLFGSAFNTTTASSNVTQTTATAATDAAGLAGTTISSYDSSTKKLTLTTTLDSTIAGATRYTTVTNVVSNIEVAGLGILDKKDTTTTGTSNGFTATGNSSITSLDISGLDGSDASLAKINAYTKIADSAITKLATASANLGAVKARVTLQQSFVSSLKDSIDKGVGSLVDADLNEESTRLQALQVQQQLGVQSLSIANQSSQAILSLFK